MQPSRRAFLLGRRPVQTPWARFIQRLTLLCQGPCATWARPARTARAAGWRPRARATWPAGRCAPSTAWPWRWTARREPPLVPACGWIPRTSAAWPAWPEDTPRWRAQPGVPLAVLAQAGLRQFDGLPGAMTLAEWLAAPAAWPAGRCAQSGPGGRRGAGRRGGGNLGAFWRERRTAAALGHAAAAGAGAVPAEHGAGRRRLRRGRRLGRSLPAGRAAATGARHGQPGASAAGARRHAGLGAGGAAAVPAAGEAASGDAPPLDDAAGRRDAGWMPGSRRCSTRMVVFPYSLSRNSGGPRAAGKMGWPAGAGWRTGAARARSHIAPAAVGIEFPLSCTSTCFSPIPWMPIFAKPPSNITSSGAPAKSPSPPPSS